LTRSRFNSTNSGPEQAGSLESTIELMQGGLNALKTHAEEVMGPGRAPQLVGDAEQKKIEHIQGVISRLRGEQAAQSATSAAPSAVPTATGPNGHKIVVQNGRWVDAQTGQPVQ
jgi:hypothetical protein